MANLELQDYESIMLDEVTLTRLSNLFTINRMEMITYEVPDKIWASITFDMNLDLI